VVANHSKLGDISTNNPLESGVKMTRNDVLLEETKMNDALKHISDDQM
jgi:hypothetical protein